MDHARRVRTLFDPPREERKAPRPGELVSVEGEVAKVTFENDETGFRVIRVEREGKDKPEAWVGVFQSTPPGTRVRATGRYEVDGRHGEQLRVETLLAVAPATTAGLEKYLGSGVIPGIGPAYAKRIVEEFGERTLTVLDQEPDRIRDVPGLGEKRAEAVIKAWEAHRAVGAIMIFLQTHGASPSLATRIHKRFGPKAIDIVSRQPYRLSLDVWGVGFKTADKIARSIGIAADAPERAQAGVLQTLHDVTGRGHVFAPRPDLARLAANMLEQDEARVDEAVDALSRSAHVVLEDAGQELAVYPKLLHEAETGVATRVRDLLSAGSRGAEGAAVRARLAAAVEPAITAFEEGAHVKLAGAQRRAVEEAAKNKVLVITGGPGVGKTTIVKAILAVLDRAKLSARLAAPTGRAAKRMSEATKREATTLHRLLEFDPKERKFLRDRKRPIPTDALIVDEASMIDIELARSLFDALPDDARLVLVGDVDQLPSVGPGAVLRDLIASERVPTVRLTQIFRQAEGSLIVENAHRIQEGLSPASADSPEGTFHIIKRDSGEAAAETIQRVVTENIPKRFGLDPRRDVQVLTPMHRGDTGTIALNERLQAVLNPDGPTVSRFGRTMRAGDKVMQLKNDVERNVYNGDVGFILSLDPEARQLVVRFDEREVTYEESDLDELTLAYATSIHKSQGSEYPAVVIPLLTEHFVMLSRNLFYTAVTRGKKLVVLVADPRAIRMALAETRKEERKTWLAERIRRELRG
jgi:exodeoxyribonuclease V alpha subunit